MAVDLLPHPTANTDSADQSATKLVSGIVTDAQELLTQQINLFKVEVQEDLRLTTQAAIALGIGLAVSLVGGILLAHMLVYALEAWLGHGYLWLCYALVGGAITVAGVVLVLGSLQAFSKINPPLPETQEAIKETLEWQTEQK